MRDSLLWKNELQILSGVKKYEKLKDWPMSERPAAFIYEEIDYPEGMFHESLIKSKQKQGEAGKKVYQRFVKGK